MDAVSWLRSKTQNRWLFGLVVVFAIEPTLSALTSRFGKGGWWLGDFDAVICGAWRVANAQSPYVVDARCQGLEAAAFVYAPQVAQTFAPLVQALGAWGLHWAYLPFLAASVATLLWYAVLRPMPEVPLHLRLMGLMAIRGSPITTGNLGAVCQAAVIGASLLVRRARWLFIAVVVVAATIKPFFLTALIVLLFEDRPWRRRLITFGAALALGIATFFAMLTAAGPLGEEWRAFMSRIVMDEQPGRGLFLAYAAMGLDADTLLAYVLYGLYAAATVTAGLIVAEGNRLTGENRVTLGLGVAQMINPRLFEYNYDFYLLYPAIALVVIVSQGLSRRGFTVLSWIFVGGMAAEFLISIIGIQFISAIPHALMICLSVLIGAAVLTARQDRQQVRTWVAQPGLAMRQAVVAVITGRI
ncbi:MULTISPECIES: hypothetical protein [Asticcacaulis]|uniref:hypothetical protein n=1 Tax=Asticcacaulis TaxID=76890 RepID=UPI001AEA2DBE|nr:MULTISPECIES: hypothetical protein [Asticcacaulis]MBP2158500.1 hypothetical protein [Asticcacaulis solisilvae]MDR6799546.1 hypothetical protein [Asticcacaulis sp. BE141]